MNTCMYNVYIYIHIYIHIYIYTYLIIFAHCVFRVDGQLRIYIMYTRVCDVYKGILRCVPIDCPALQVVPQTFGCLGKECAELTDLAVATYSHPAVVLIEIASAFRLSNKTID